MPAALPTDKPPAIEGTPTVEASDVATIVERRDAVASGPAVPSHSHIDVQALAQAVAEVSGKGGNKQLITIVSTIAVVIAGVVGGTGYTVTSSGDANTQQIVREELRAYGEKMEAKVKADRDAIKHEMDRDRERLEKRIESIERNTQKTAVDIAVIRGKLDRE
jgi:methionine synthase I (cobalamin-dependent)